ncbi:MAG: cell wall metabolism sensor histidine kinase WalK [Ruminococcaceae bacterium]|nr:cell wall metabolism sensor histidine kinase WalK [Oscillospiraceae bacterium]
MFKSLSSKVIAVFISVTVLVVLITSAVFMSLFFRYAYEEKSDALLDCAMGIADFISSENSLEEPTLKAKNFPDYATLVSSVVDANLWICKTDGFFIPLKFASWPVSTSQLTDKEQKIIDDCLSGKQSVTTGFSHNFSEETLTVVVPIYAADKYGTVSSEVIGAVLMHSPLKYINETFAASSALLVGTFVFAVILTVIFAVFLGLHLTKPIKEMCNAASSLAKGDFSIKVHTNDRTELQDLAHALNHLAHNLGSTFTRLKNEKDKLSNIIENISDGLASFDTNMHLQKYNTALLKICSLNQLEDPAVTEMITQVLQTGQKKTVVLNGKDILKFTATRIQNKDITEGVVVIVQDISQSERLNQLRTDFVANVSHEFRTPLTIIKGSVEALLDGAAETEEERFSYYSRIETESKALERLVRDLLDTSKYKAGKIVLEIKPMDAVWLIADITEKLKPVAAEKGIALIFEPKELEYVLADYDRLRQMIIIFIDNAIKFTPKGGSVSVFAEERDDGYAYISIKDTGVGIPEEDVPFIFDRFYKVDKARGGSETGTGLGLSIAWELAELHKGTILVESEVGKGTTFTIVIPIAPPPEDDEEYEE